MRNTLKLTKANLKALPALYSNDGRGESAIAHVKFFDPCGSWTWYASEGSLVCPNHSSFDCTECPKETWTEFMFFGLVDGIEPELGYFSMNELAAFKGPLGIGIERDLHWKPRPLSECRRKGV